MKACLTALLIALLTPVTQAQHLERVRQSQWLRVCIWPDYYGISYRSPKTGQLSGIDIDLAGELASDLGVRPQFVDSSFETLIDDIEHDRCDVAMFGIGVSPERQVRLAFSQTYLQADIFGVTTRSSRTIRQWSDIDRPGVRVAVQAGTYMEPVMSRTLKKATLVVVRPPLTREQELEAGRIDVFMADYPYSLKLIENADWARRVAPPQPFHVLPRAYAVAPGDEAWLHRIDAFVAQVKRDGRLERAAQRAGLAGLTLR